MPDTTLTSAEQVIAGVQAAYDRVKLWPEDRMRPSAVEELGPGFTDLLLLRNLVPDLLSLARAGIEAGKAEESMRERAAAMGGLYNAAKELIDAIRDQHETKLPPHRYGVPYWAVNKLWYQLDKYDAARALPLTEGGDKP